MGRASRPGRPWKAKIVPVISVVSGRPPYAGVAFVLLAFLAVSLLVIRGRGRGVPPLFATLSPELGPGILVSLILTAALWFSLPKLLGAPAPLFLVVVVLFGWGFSVVLAGQAGGTDAVTAPFRRSVDYYANVPLVDALGPGEFAAEYPNLADRLSLHARTHPPGAPLLLWALSEATGASLLTVALLVALIGALGAVPTYWLARETYGERPAKFAAALFAAAPGVVLFSATSMDAVFMTLVALAIAALARAQRSDVWSVAAGLLTALALAFTFGAMVGVGLVGAGMGALAWSGSDKPILLRRGALALGGLLIGSLLLRAFIGIDLIASFRAALEAHLDDPAFAHRSYAYWVLGNLVAFLLIAGIGQVALLVEETLSRWRIRRLGLETVLWGSIVVSSASGVFRGEVDHIWLFFLPVLAAAAGSAMARPKERLRSDDLSPMIDSPSASIAAPYRREFRAIVVVSLLQAMVMEVLLNTFW